jgi:hypothetical protein
MKWTVKNEKLMVNDFLLAAWYKKAATFLKKAPVQISKARLLF